MDKARKPILCLDFDGVCHSYTSGWQGIDAVPDAPVDGLFEFLETVSDHFEIHIFSTRSSEERGIQAMSAWFAQHRAAWRKTPAGREARDELELVFPTQKPHALVFIDDRALTFTGEFPPLGDLLRFKPWNRQ